MSPGTRAALNAARITCGDATRRHMAAKKGRVPADHEALGRRHLAALRLPPLPDGRRDPMDLAA